MAGCHHRKEGAYVRGGVNETVCFWPTVLLLWWWSCCIGLSCVIPYCCMRKTGAYYFFFFITFSCWPQESIYKIIMRQREEKRIREDKREEKRRRSSITKSQGVTFATPIFFCVVFLLSGICSPRQFSMKNTRSTDAAVAHASLFSTNAWIWCTQRVVGYRINWRTQALRTVTSPPKTVGASVVFACDLAG